MFFDPGNTLENYFYTMDINNFPRKIDYITQYKSIKQHLRNNIQKFIDEGSDHQNGHSRHTLTTHDVSHFDRVIEVTTDLVSATDFKLTPYEIFLLLTAVQVHDIGNILGRENHETTLREVFYDAFPPHELSELDNIENNIFLDIAQTHSGKVNVSKDTISPDLSLGLFS